MRSVRVAAHEAAHESGHDTKDRSYYERMPDAKGVIVRQRVHGLEEEPEGECANGGRNDAPGP